MRVLVVVSAVLVAATPAPSQNQIGVGPPTGIFFLGGLDDPLSAFSSQGGIIPGPLGSTSTISIGATAPDLEFKFDHVEVVLPTSGAPNFLVISPASGKTLKTTSAYVGVGLNERVVRRLAPGTYEVLVFFSLVDQSPASSGRVVITLRLNAPPAPDIRSVVNAASYQSGIAPGQIVSILGTHLCQTATSATYGETGLYPTAVENTSVTFDGIEAPLLYVSQNQINALVPYGVANHKTASIIVKRTLSSILSSDPFRVPIADSAPGIFTATADGTGQAAMLQYPDASYNSVGNPAAPGSAITLFATGIGPWTGAPTQDGTIFLGPVFGPAYPNPPRAPVSLTIGGKPATVSYAGPSLYQLWSLLQINAVVPGDAPSGQQPVVLKVGDNDNSAQKVTMAIR